LLPWTVSPLHFSSPFSFQLISGQLFIFFNRRSLRPKELRYLANENKVPALLDRTAQKHQEAEGKKSRTWSTFKTEVETTKGAVVNMERPMYIGIARLYMSTSTWILCYKMLICPCPPNRPTTDDLFHTRPLDVWEIFV
jgi:hypothetical protein